MISVCMATYNGERFIREQVDSILSQLSSYDELVVSDDGSTDQTLSILEKYGDKRIKIYHNTKWHGVNGNFENALRHASGDYIFLSDQDDVWLPGKVEACVSALQNADCIVHDCYITDQQLNVKSKSLFEELKAHSGMLHNLIKNGFTGCCMAFNRNVCYDILPIPNSKKFFYDQWIGLKSILKFKVKFIDSKLIYFRRHNNNTSPTAGKNNRSLIDKFISRVLILKNLIF